LWYFRPSLRFAWRTLLSDAGVRVVRLHDARHSAATTLLALGVPVRVVADTVGHSQTRVTQDTYQHVLPALAQDAADRRGRRCGSDDGWHTNWHTAERQRVSLGSVCTGHQGWS
jgi:integrase